MSAWKIIKSMSRVIDISREVANLEDKKAAEMQRSVDSQNAWVETVKTWRDIGQEFEYLGRKMVLTSLYKQRLESCGTSIYVIKEPDIEARYLDNSGVIQTLKLNKKEALALALAAEKLSHRTLHQLLVEAKE